MTISSRIDPADEAEDYDPLVTPEFASLAEFAGFCDYEAAAVQETDKNIPALSDQTARQISTHLMARPESASLLGAMHQPINEVIIRKWLDRTIAGPFDSDLADFLRSISHLGGAQVTFPGVQVALPPQLILALTAWVQGQILTALGGTCDVATASAAGAAWMNQFMLQLGIILEPCLTNPDRPLGRHDAAEFHPYADFAGFGPKQAAILRKTGPLLGPAARLRDHLGLRLPAVEAGIGRVLPRGLASGAAQDDTEGMVGQNHHRTQRRPVPLLHVQGGRRPRPRRRHAPQRRHPRRIDHRLDGMGPDARHDRTKHHRSGPPRGTMCSEQCRSQPISRWWVKRGCGC
jgi:hypothetical protein